MVNEQGKSLREQLQMIESHLNKSESFIQQTEADFLKEVNSLNEEFLQNMNYIRQIVEKLEKQFE